MGVGSKAFVPGGPGTGCGDEELEFPGRFTACSPMGSFGIGLLPIFCYKRILNLIIQTHTINKYIL